MSAGRPPVCRNGGLMSGVVGKKLGRMYSLAGPWVSSVRYSISSPLKLRQVK